MTSYLKGTPVASDIRVVQVRYNQPLLGDVPLLSAQWIERARPLDAEQHLHTICVPVIHGGLCYESVQDVPLLVLQAMVAEMPDAAEAQQEEERE